MTPQTKSLFHEIKALGVELTINGKDLRLSGPKGAIIETYNVRLMNAKPEIVAALVESITEAEYHPKRVLISVLLTPAASTLISTSPAPGCGLATCL